MEKVTILLSSYNNEECIDRCLKSCFAQEYKNLNVVVVDDGSTDSTTKILESFKREKDNFQFLALPHGERGVARNKAIELARAMNSKYIYILDSDMILEHGLIENCIDYFKKNKEVGALVIPELAYSDYKNFYSKVKVFERNIINNSGEDLGLNSIEAARLWKLEAFDLSGGISEKQISFEETQPTIRYIEKGGIIKRAVFTKVHHNEKFVTLKNILKKKKYYFSVMNKTINTEEKGLKKTLQRWYFFRPVLYRKSNLKKYVQHPVLTLGVINMYLMLTVIGVFEIIKSKFKRKK